MNDIAPLEAPPRGLSPAPLAGTTAVVVLGMHRSGTSALAGMLSRLGVAFGPRLMPASRDNPRGYWEHADVVALHHRLMAEFGYGWDDIRPLPDGFGDSAAACSAARELAAILPRDFAGAGLWGVKDPRLCRLVPLWLPLLAELAATPRFVLALRHPLDVAASLAARDDLAVERGLLLWLRHVLEAEQATRGHRRVLVHYEDLVAAGGWRPIAAQIATALAIAWPESGPAIAATVDDYLSADLRHQRAGDGARRGRMGGWVEAVYDALRGGPDDAGAVCDAVGRELARGDRLFLPLVGATGELAARLATAEHQAAELRALALRQDGELKLLRQRPGPAVAAPPAVADGYAQWIASRASTAIARADWVAERVREWPQVPRLALGMILPAGTEARLDRTLASLRAQIAGAWELHVVAEADRPPALAGEPGLVWHAAADGATARLNRALAASSADWLGLIDAGDRLAPHALFSLGEAMAAHPEWGAAYSDEDRIDPQGVQSGPHFKPDFNLDLLRSLPYVGGLLAVRREIFAELGGFDPARDGTEEYDLALRLAERLEPARFGHIADILYHRSTVSGRSVRPIGEICADMPRVVQAHLDRLGIAATAEPGEQPQFCRVRYRHDGPEPLVTIIVPTRDQPALLKRCIEAVLKETQYENYEIVVVDNGSADPEACAYLQAIEDKFGEIGSRIRVLRHPGAFNFSAMNNRAAREEARGDYLCLLNNDAAPLAGDWLGELMALARRPDVGVVGAKLLVADGRVQHAGVVLGIGWGAPAEHPYAGEPEQTFGYWGRARVVQQFSAVTGACLLTRRSVYEAVGGLDEDNFAVAFNDIDFCLRVGVAGYRVLWTPFARLLHDSSASLNAAVEQKSVEEKQARFRRERVAMFQRWLPQIAFDPAYNRNLTAMAMGFAVETEGPPTWDPALRPRPRVIAYPADREGCGEYRIIAPSRALFGSGRLHCCATMRLATPPEVERIAPDSVILQRQLEGHQMAFIEQLQVLSPTFRIFEIDDLITNLPAKSIHRKGIARDIGDRLKQALAMCNRLVVSTEPLARAYGRWCDETVVLPNRLEKSRWIGLAPKRRPGGKPRVGWAGAAGHTGDLAVIAGAVQATAKEVDWVFFGMCPDNLRPFIAEAHAWVPLHDYAEKLASLDLDLAVAPLEHHPFNDAKSNLRLLEYGILGYPVLCTDIVPYQGGLPVHRVANRPNAWIKVIRELVADREALRREGETLRRAVVADWLIDDHLDEWMRAWLP
jgi:GT2 family glycosyltransferase